MTRPQFVTKIASPVKRKASPLVLKKMFLRRVVIGVAALATAASGAVLAASGAGAAVIGTGTISPATGADTTSMTLTTSAACPTTATNIIMSVTGSGFPAAGQTVVGNSPITTYGTSPSGGLIIPLTQTMRDYANTAGFTTLTGPYTFTVTCRTAFNATSLGDFTATINFTSNTTYVSASGTATTTTLGQARG